MDVLDDGPTLWTQGAAIATATSGTARQGTARQGTAAQYNKRLSKACGMIERVTGWRRTIADAAFGGGIEKDRTDQPYYGYCLRSRTMRLSILFAIDNVTGGDVVERVDLDEVVCVFVSQDCWGGPRTRLAHCCC